jgi:hypothetical protein
VFCLALVSVLRIEEYAKPSYNLKP